MTISLALTKLRSPRLRPNLVARTQLIGRLNEGLRQNRKLTLLTAPAGFGKTTLAAEWLKQLDRPFAWICLDEGDNDPVRFLSLVVAALRTTVIKDGRLVKGRSDRRPEAVMPGMCEGSQGNRDEDSTGGNEK